LDRGLDTLRQGLAGADQERLEYVLDTIRTNVVQGENKKNSGKIYRQLDKRSQEIRLLKLLPLAEGQGGESTIECALITKPIADAPAFDALSYVWGKPGRWRPIRVDATAFFVQPNLYDVLKTFRNTRQCPRYLWVDAICINQSDVLERNHQVPLMRLIYTQAETVRVWLGCGKPESIACMQSIARGNSDRDFSRDTKIAGMRDLISSSWYVLKF